jgi:hypothetical protein
MAFPPSFKFPESFQFDLNYAQVIDPENQIKMRVFEGSQSVLFDADYNRVRIERESRIFYDKDTSVQLYDFNKMRMLVSDPKKKFCMQVKIQDISPVSLVPREHD